MRPRNNHIVVRLPDDPRLGDDTAGRPSPEAHAPALTGRVRPPIRKGHSGRAGMSVSGRAFAAGYPQIQNMT
jgi:hypothetical protein